MGGLKGGEVTSEGADGTDVAAIYIYCHMVRTPCMALWGFGAKSQIDGVDG